MPWPRCATARWPPPNPGSCTASTRTRWWSTARPTLARRVMWPRAARRNLGTDPKEGEQGKSDSEIRDDVINELQWDPQITEPDAIGVAVKDGAVTLTGHVSTYAQRLAAAPGPGRGYGGQAGGTDPKAHGA